MTRIFISYRRSDQPDSVGRVRDRLNAFYGDDAIFRDTDDIPIGTQFEDLIDAELARCQVLLVIIGPGWLDATDVQGNRRLDQPGDWVRKEIETGLKRTADGLRIAPV